MYSTVDFNPKLQAPGLPDFRKQFNFSERRADEGLAAKSRIHAHNEYMMNKGKNFIERMDGSAGVQDHSGLAPVRCNKSETAIEMDASFLMDGDPIGPGFGERRN